MYPSTLLFGAMQPFHTLVGFKAKRWQHHAPISEMSISSLVPHEGIYEVMSVRVIHLQSFWSILCIITQVLNNFSRVLKISVGSPVFANINFFFLISAKHVFFIS